MSVIGVGQPLAPSQKSGRAVSLFNETGDWPVVWSHAIRQIECHFVKVAPAPSFGGIIAFDNWMSGSLKVFRRVAIGGIVTASHVAARTTQTQMNPFIAGLQALLAAKSTRCDVANIFQVTAPVCHRDYLFGGTL